MTQHRFTLETPLIAGDTITIDVKAPPPPIPPPAPIVSNGYFTRAPAFTSPVPSGAKTDPLTAQLAKTTAGYLSSAGYSVPIARSDGSIKPVPAPAPDGQYGMNGLKSIPGFIPGPVPATGTDGHFVIVDAAGSYEFFKATVMAGAVVTAKTACYFPFVGPGSSTDTYSVPDAAGLSLLAGLITAAEMQAGVINHALAFSIPGIAPGPPRPPATKSVPTGNGFMVEGTRIQLDPAVDLSALTKAEQIVGKALQTYGAYCRDNGGVFAIYREVNASYAWPGKLNLPWSRLRVIAP